MNQTQVAYREGELVKGRFVVQAFEGSGPIGQRYRALDEEVGIEVQLRVVHERLLPTAEALRLFLERMQRSFAFSHPALLRVHAGFEDHNRAVLAVQRAVGPTLAEYVRARQALPFEEARPILGQVAAALAHAHHHGVVLADLRPSSVVTLPDGVKVTSIGVAPALPREPYLFAISTLPEAHHVAPELRRAVPLDARTDVYSFAALTLALLSGRAMDTFRSGAFAVAPAMMAVLERSLDADMVRRAPTIEALLMGLDRAAGETRRHAGPVTLPSSMTVPGSPVVAPAAALDPARQEVTRQIDEDELKRLAGEVADLLETTRQASLEEIEPLREMAVGTTVTRVGEPADVAGRAPPREALSVGARGAKARPGLPGLIEEDDDLEFDLGPPRPAKTEPPRPPPRPSRTKTREVAIPPPPTDPSRTAQTAVARVAALSDPLAGLDDDDGGDGGRELAFQSGPDPFAIALEAAHEKIPVARRASAPAMTEAHDTVEHVLTEADAVPEPAWQPAVIIDPELPIELPESSVALQRAPEPPSLPSAPAVEVVPPALPPPPRPPAEVPRALVEPPRPVEDRDEPRRGSPPIRRADPSQAGREWLFVGLGIVCLVAALAGLVYVLRAPSAQPAPPERARPRKQVPEPTMREPSAPTPSRAAPVPAPEPARPQAAPTPELAKPPAAEPAKPQAAPAPVAAAPIDAATGCPENMVRLAAYCIDAWEFPGRDQMPLVNIAHADAEKRCADRGARLCTPKEWESACRGARGASWPYGPSYEEALCNTGAGELKPTGSFPTCISGAGAFDMSGNAAEWTSAGTIRGGAVGEGNAPSRCSRDKRSDGAAAPLVGFRCCSDPKK